MVAWRSNLWLATVTAVLLVWTHGVHLSQTTDTAGLVLAPAQVEREPPDTVQRMLLMGGLELPDCLLVFVFLHRWLDVQTGTAHADGLGELPLVSWFDFLQGG